MAVNSRIGTINNLEQGGTYDLLTVQFVSGFPEGFVLFDVGNTPRRTTGIQKVAQTFMRILLTTKGSDPVRPNFGTNFSNYVMNSNLDGDMDSLASLVDTYVTDAEQQCKSYLNSRNGDLASQVSSVRLIGVSTTEDSITMTLQIITRSGESAKVAVPFPQLDLELTNG